MELVNIKNIKLNEVNTVQGFVETIRNKKNIAFLVLKDISGKLQITLIKGNNQLLDETIDKITPQSVITVTGKVVSNENVKLNGIEMLPESIVIETIADSPIPLDDTSLIDQRLDYR
jgi:aspartyl-tRNA synthetase